MSKEDYHTSTVEGARAWAERHAEHIRAGDDGDATDYSLTGATVNNTTDGTSVSGQTFSFANDGGASGGGRSLTTGNNNFQSLVGAGTGETITVTGNLTRTGYESVEVTASTTY